MLEGEIRPAISSAVEARRLIGARQLSPIELLDSCVRRIEATNAAVNAVVAIDVEAARRQAKAIEATIGRAITLACWPACRSG